MDQERVISRLWRVNRTIHELVRDRGFLVAENEIDMTLDQFKQDFVRAAGDEGDEHTFWYLAAS